MSLFLDDRPRDLRASVSELLVAVIPLVVISGLVSSIVASLSDRQPVRWLFGRGLAGVGGCDFADSVTM
ncbi:MAG: hypothetical protein ABW128_08245 [Rhizorhabdus sp.]